MPAISCVPNTESQILGDYLPKLVRLAQRNLSKQLRRKVDAEDLGATVIRTVIRRAREDRMTIEHTEDFWNLLVAITLNKARKKARFWKAQKRDMCREQPVSDAGPQLADIAIDYRELPEPTQEDGDELCDLLSCVNQRLDDRCQVILAGKLEGKSHSVIASELNVSTKFVSRYLKKIEVAIREAAREED